MNKFSFRFLALSCFLVASISSAAPIPTVSKRIELTPRNISLSYQNFEGTAIYACKSAFTYTDNPYDFTVTCTDENKTSRKYAVHLAVSRYTFSSVPRTKYEILYWVNQEGATTWLSFKESVNLSQIDASQTISGDNAELHLTINL